MAKTKIYFWLKVDKKFFDNIFIKRLKNMPGGYTMTVIYIRLMLESLESDCILYYEGYFNELTEELALKLDVSEDDIQMTMAYFTKCGLIQVDGDKNAELLQAKAMIESETNWAGYKREQRKQAKLDTVQNKRKKSNSCPTEIEIELEKEIEIEKERERELDTGQPARAAYGRYENVFLSQSELDGLKADLPDKWNYYIDRLSCHIASSGKRYRSHAATIYKWAQEDAAKKAPKKGIPDYSCKEGESL